MSSRVRRETSRSRRAEEMRRKDRSAGRSLRHMAAVLLLVALWMGARQDLPDQTAVWAGALERLRAGAADLRDAFVQLGEDLSQGEGVAVAVGNWRETIFAPEESEDTAETEENDELSEAQLEDSGTA